jgi:light-regulated signal transduction histidine kinase (bacteriophytochrome)
MSSLIDDLLTFSRISQTNIEFHPVDLNELLHGIVHDLEIPIQEKQATIDIGQLCVIDGFKLQLGQVFQNLISNSLKFSQPGKAPVITIRSSIIRTDEGERCFIQYQDNGIGFRQEYAEKIFEIFQRLHTRDKFEGTGVGLAIVKKIITQHNGEIKAFGKDGEGVRFEISLPVKQ